MLQEPRSDEDLEVKGFFLLCLQLTTSFSSKSTFKSGSPPFRDAFITKDSEGGGATLFGLLSLSVTARTWAEVDAFFLDIRAAVESSLVFGSESDDDDISGIRILVGLSKVVSFAAVVVEQYGRYLRVEGAVNS
jgi:hypothetical protein